MKKIDRRSSRTRQALRDALLSLMVEKGWDELSVQDICDRANIGRSTFYLHFPSKEELLTGSLDDLRVMLTSAPETKARDTSPPLSFINGLLEHLYQQRQLCRSIFGRRSAHTVQARFRDMVKQMIFDDLARNISSEWQRQATAHYLAGALVELLAWWIDRRPLPPIEDIEQLYTRLARGSIAKL